MQLVGNTGLKEPTLSGIVSIAADGLEGILVLPWRSILKQGFQNMEGRGLCQAHHEKP